MSSVIIPDQDGNSAPSVVFLASKILFLVLSLVLFRVCLDYITLPKTIIFLLSM